MRILRSVTSPRRSERASSRFSFSVERVGAIAIGDEVFGLLIAIATICPAK